MADEKAAAAKRLVERLVVEVMHGGQLHVPDELYSLGGADILSLGHLTALLDAFPGSLPILKWTYMDNPPADDDADERRLRDLRAALAERYGLDVAAEQREAWHRAEMNYAIHETRREMAGISEEGL